MTQRSNNAATSANPSSNVGSVRDSRLAGLPSPPTLSNLDFVGFLNLLREAEFAERRAMDTSYALGRESDEEKLEREANHEKAKALHEQRQEDFRTAINAALTNAYVKGADNAVEKAERTAWNARSVALYLLVLAVVLMPAIAMGTNISPQDFGSYIAPVTGITGTVVGYWFSKGSPGG